MKEIKWNSSVATPIIGVTPLWDDKLQSVWMLSEYMDAIRAAGGIPVVLPLKADKVEIRQMVSTFDGFLFTGGQDVDVCPERWALESALLDATLEADKPVFGICRGLQFINAALGGTLWQDLPTEHPSGLVHRQWKPYDKPTHTVSLSGPIQELLSKVEIPVNTLHHQAVKDLAPGLEVMAVASDGLIEAAWMPGKRFVWGVQWHPEYMFKADADSLKLFEAFIHACK